jgi:hypothetical protein
VTSVSSTSVTVTTSGRIPSGPSSVVGVPIYRPMPVSMPVHRAPMPRPRPVSTPMPRSPMSVPMHKPSFGRRMCR